ncbi:MAG: hypothetical protein JWN60_1999 [Acidobacteria bacterium]|jgi:thioredoxin-like negative regulator of GroEL|nr:hypothetical protein [Acidobacteriota bacterium]
MMAKIFLLTMALLFFVSQASARQVDWVKNFAEAEKIARQTGKPLLLDFTAEWCGVCRRMDLNFWTRADVIELSKQFVSVKIDGEKAPLIAKRFRVEGFPTVVFTDSWGVGLDSHMGFGQNGDRVIIAKASAFPKDFALLKNAGDMLEKDPNDGAAFYEFAAFYSQKNLYALSTDVFKRILRLENQKVKKAERKDVLYRLATDLLKHGRSTEALVYFETLQNEFPQSENAEMIEYNIFEANLRKNNLAEAGKSLEKLKTNFPDSKMLKQAEQSFSQARLKIKTTKVTVN